MKLNQVIIKHVKLLDQAAGMFEITTGIDGIRGTAVEFRSERVSMNHTTYVGTIGGWITRDGKQIAMGHVEDLLNFEARRRLLLLRYATWLTKEVIEQAFQSPMLPTEYVDVQMPIHVLSPEEQRERRREEVKRMKEDRGIRYMAVKIALAGAGDLKEDEDHK